MSIKRTAFRIAALLLALGFIEGTAQIAYRVRSPQRLWIAEAAPSQPRLFAGHPYLAVAGRANLQARFGNTVSTHNSLGYRGAEPLSHKVPGRARVVAVGGSSTYGIFVSDEDAWPARLARKAPDLEVLNFGVPGYATVEHVIQSTFQFADLAPDVAVYYVGWNDLPNVHVKDLDAMYAEFHGRRQPLALAIDEPAPGWFASTYYGRKAWARASARRVGEHRVPDPDAFTARPDPRALDLFRRNLTMIAAICRARHVRAIFVPQVLNCARLTAQTGYGWVPYVRDRDLCTVNAQFTEALIAVANREQVPVVTSVTAPHAFGASDFLDEGHFTGAGADRFAEHVLNAVRQWGPTHVAANGALENPPSLRLTN